LLEETRFITSRPALSFAWLFHGGLRTLQRAYQSSRSEVDKQRARIEQRAAAFQAKVDAGEEQLVDWGEDSLEGYTLEDELNEQLYAEEKVLNLIRLAFVISLHHYIEQQIGERLPDKKYVQSEAFVWLKSRGWKPLEKELNELRLAANCAKHSGGSSAKQLYILRPDMFRVPESKKPFQPGYSSLALSDRHVDAFFDAVRQSIPPI
jgi:hypothetical protein